MRNANPFHCYTDGSCKKSEGNPGGWGVFIRTSEGIEVEKFGSATKTSASAMELTAIIEALKYLPSGACATVYSDSKITLEHCSRWIEIWKRSNWRNADPANLALFKNIDRLITEKALKVGWKWIRGHHGNSGNERANALATRGAREAKSLSGNPVPGEACSS